MWYDLPTPATELPDAPLADVLTDILDAAETDAHYDEAFAYYDSEE